jgi:protein-S-isoprenylcysteine O-methyltransferase Ste14
MPASGNNDHPDVIMLPPFILLIALIVAIGLEFTTSLNFLPPAFSATSWEFYLGLALLVAALALGVSALRTFKTVGTNPSPHEPSLNLATTGPYRFSRNPMYLGFMMSLAGLSLVASLEWGLVLVPVLAVVLHYGVVTREEAYLSAKFGKPYREFMNRTRRWI